MRNLSNIFFNTRLAVALVLVSVIVAPVADATTIDDLCDALDDPCVVSTKVIVDSNTTLDLGGRALQVADGAGITWKDNLTVVSASSCDFAAKSSISEAKDSTGSGFLWMGCDASTLAGKISTLGSGMLVQGPGPHVLSGKVKVKGDEAGVIAVDTHAPPGTITISGKILAKAKSGPPPGEFRFISNFGDITVAESAKIKLKGATADPFTEIVWFEAGTGSLTIDGSIDARAKSGAYAFNFEANQAVVFGPKSKIQAKGSGSGPEIGINSQSASVVMNGKISAATGKIEGDGGLVHVCAADDITVVGGAKIDTSTGGFDGQIVMGAGDHVTIGDGSGGAQLTSNTDGLIELCGNTTGVTIAGASKIIPDPETVGINECLSPNSQVIFFLDCNQ